MSLNNDDNNENTSLLASSTAPPDETRPRPSLVHPYHPGREPPTATTAQNQPQQHPYALSSTRQTLTQSTLEEMERGAKRLADDDSVHGLGDTDSVNGLLGSFAEDDSYIGEIDSPNKADKHGEPVSMKDLEYLSSQVGNELLDAHDDKQLEYTILNKSLKLTGTPKELGADEEFGDEEEDVTSKRVHESTRALVTSLRRVSSGGAAIRMPRPPSHPEIEPGEEEFEERKKIPKYFTPQVISMLALMIFVMLTLLGTALLGTLAVGPPRQPLGEYQILEAHEGEDFWQYWNFFAGKDSAGSNGYINYVSEKAAREVGIVEVIAEIVSPERMIEVYAKGDTTFEEDWLTEDLAFLDELKRQEVDASDSAEEAVNAALNDTASNSTGRSNSNSTISNSASTKKEVAKEKDGSSDKKKKSGSNSRQLEEDMTEDDDDSIPPPKLEPFNPDTNSTPFTETFVVISSSPTPEGPRNSVRLEGKRRFNRGLFIIDLRHMPAGCGTWPAFWLTDEANWPVNGEIDIVEGVNYQDTAKTALHTTKVCEMDEVPEGSKTGSWDTSVGIPNAKTGIPDMTFRWAQNCFVYDPHQWINQGCVATDLKLEGRSLGMPLNQAGGGVYALEWDPVNRHIRTWVFSPHGRVPSNLRDALRTATNEDVVTRVAPDTNQWGLPYGHFPIGEGTNCEAGHFRNMRLVINLAFCGTVAGNRYFMDCPKKHKKWKTCEEWVASNPDELKEAYWKIRGVYVYERAWERKWKPPGPKDKGKKHTKSN